MCRGRGWDASPSGRCLATARTSTRGKATRVKCDTTAHGNLSSLGGLRCPPALFPRLLLRSPPPFRLWVLLLLLLLYLLPTFSPPLSSTYSHQPSAREVQTNSAKNMLQPTESHLSSLTCREGIRLRSIPRYTDFRLLERDLMAAAGVAAAAAQTVDVTNPRQCQIQSPSPGMLVAVSGAATADTLVKCLHSRQSNGAPQTCIYYDAVSEQHVARQTDRGQGRPTSDRLYVCTYYTPRCYPPSCRGRRRPTPVFLSPTTRCDPGEYLEGSLRANRPYE